MFPCLPTIFVDEVGGRGGGGRLADQTDRYDSVSRRRVRGAAILPAPAALGARNASSRGSRRRRRATRRRRRTAAAFGWQRGRRLGPKRATTRAWLRRGQRLVRGARLPHTPRHTQPRRMKTAAGELIRGPGGIPAGGACRGGWVGRGAARRAPEGGEGGVKKDRNRGTCGGTVRMGSDFPACEPQPI